MKITFILPTVDMSGGIKVVSIYAKTLSAKGHEVLLVSPPKVKQSFRNKLKSFLRGQGWPKTKSNKSHLDGLGLNHTVLEKYRPVTDEDLPDADVVIATWWETAEWVNRLNSSKGAKVYFIQHHEVFEFLPVIRSAATYRLPLHKIVIARWLLDIMRNEYGDNDVDLVPNSVDKKQFYAPIREKQAVPTVGFLFAYAGFKGVGVTLQVIKQLKVVIPNLRIISFGSYMPDKFPAWDDSIEFYYSPAQDKIRDLYAQCDVWITASRTEGFNLPAMEAMACRTPVISTKAGWPEEAIVNGQNGFLTEVDDVAELVTFINKLLSATNEQWKEFSQQAFQTVENSSWQASTILFERALMNAV